MPVTHDAAGDWAMTERFCEEVLGERKPAVALTWLCDPDHTLHGVPLGSPAHAEALAGAERCVREIVRTVERLRAEGEEILLLVGSDHGQETIGAAVSIEDWLAERGLWRQLEAGDVAVAGQGTSALLYATDRGRAALLAVLGAMRASRGPTACSRATISAATASRPKVAWLPPSTWRGGRRTIATACPAGAGWRRKAASLCRSAAASTAAGGRMRRGLS